MPDAARAADFCDRWPQSTEAPALIVKNHSQPAASLFRRAPPRTLVFGSGTLYFDVYHRHLEKFVGSNLCVVEIGVYSGGSLGCGTTTLDRALASSESTSRLSTYKVYENECTTIEIGDQADREFWTSFRKRHPRVDIVIDDGGHQPEQQMTTLEEMLPHLAPGGVYICEDVHGQGSHFAAFTHALADHLNESHCTSLAGGVPRSTVTPLQAAVHSITYYPFLVVIERNSRPPAEFIGPKHGTEWQPFFK